MLIKRKKEDHVHSGAALQAFNTMEENFAKGISKLEPLECLCGAQNSDSLNVSDDFFPYNKPTKMLVKLCLNCGIARKDPYFSEETLIDFYTNHYRRLHSMDYSMSEEEFVARIVNQDIPYSGYYAHSFLNPIIKKYKKHHKKEKVKIFEIGCGYGAILYKFYKQGEDVYGCDYGPQGVEFAKRIGMKNIQIGGLETLNQYGIADVIILHHVLEHVPQISEFLQNIKKIANKNTLVYLAVPNITTGSVRNAFGYYEHFQSAHCWHFNVNNFDHLLKINGYRKLQGNESIQAVYKLEIRNNIINRLICKFNKPNDLETSFNSADVEYIIWFLKTADKYRQFLVGKV